MMMCYNQLAKRRLFLDGFSFLWMSLALAFFVCVSTQFVDYIMRVHVKCEHVKYNVFI